MLAKDRRDYILDELRLKNTIKITEIVERLNVSNETARRDLEALQSEKLVKRVHGGAVLVEQSTKSVYPKRKGAGLSEKRAIGRLAASLVHEGDTIMLGNGTTVLEIARNLKHYKDLTVLTTSIPVIIELVSPISD